MDFLSTLGRDYSTRTGPHFTVPSANSLSYSLDRRPLRNSRYQREDWEETKDLRGTRPEPVIYSQSNAYIGAKGQSLTRKELPLQQNQTSTQVKSVECVSGQVIDSERQGRTPWRSGSLSSRSKSLDWRTQAKSPERRLSYRADPWRRTGDLVGADGSRVRTTVQAYNSVRSANGMDTTLSIDRGQSLPSRLMFASVGPKGGQSILERIEKLYGTSEFGNTGDYKTTEPQTYYKDSFGGTFPRRFSSGEHKQISGEIRESLMWTASKDASMSNYGLNRTRASGLEKKQTEAREFEGTSLSEHTRYLDSGTRSLDRTRSRSTIAAKIRAARAAEEVDQSVQTDTILKGKSEVSPSTNKQEAKDMDRKNWSRTTVRGIHPVKSEADKDGQTWIKREGPSDDVFVNVGKVKVEKKLINDKYPAALTASVRNKISQFEALSQRAQASSPRRAFSVPEHISKICDGVQRSSSARVIGTQTYKWGGLKDERGQGGIQENQTFRFERENKLQQDKTSKMEINFGDFSVEETKMGQGKEVKNTKVLNKYSNLKTTLELPLNKNKPLTSDLISIDERDFSKIASPEEESIDSSGSEISSPTSDSDKTPTNTPDRSPLPSPIAPPQKTPPFAAESKPSKQSSPPLVTNLPDLVSRENLNGKKRVLDLNAWLDGLNPGVSVWDNDGDDDDDDSTQRDEDSIYDSDSGESSVTITSVVSNKSFSVSLADLCNFAGADYDSENDSDEWQSSGRRSVSLSSDISGFSYVSVLPTEELDKLIEDVKSIGESNLQDFEDVHVVVLHKDVGVGLGFSLAGGVDQNKPVTVHKVFHSGVAAQEGSVKEGDHVLSINGTALSGFAHWEALRVLRRAKGREMGVVVLKKPDSRPVSNGRPLTVNQVITAAQSSEKSQCISVNLEKSERGLGFSLEGGIGSSLGNKPLSVQKIFQGGPVDKILPGDEVLEVNGVSVVGMRRLEAWTLIRKLPPGPVNVVLRRPPPTHKT